MQQKFEESMILIQKSLDKLARLWAREEVQIMRNEMKVIKQVLKEKLHVDIDRL